MLQETLLSRQLEFALTQCYEAKGVSYERPTSVFLCEWLRSSVVLKNVQYEHMQYILTIQQYQMNNKFSSKIIFRDKASRLWFRKQEVLHVESASQTYHCSVRISG